MEIHNSLINSASFKLERYNAANSKLKLADPEVLAAEPNNGKRDIFIRSDASGNERGSSVYENVSYDELISIDESENAPDTSVRVVAGMSNRELYELLTGEKCPRASSGDIDFSSNSVDVLAILSRAMIKRSEGIGTLIPTRENIGKFKENIASFYGEIARRMDGAYAEGKFTDEEYQMLNAGLNEQIEKTIHNTETSMAFFALGKQRGSLTGEKLKQTILREKAMTPEEFQEDLRQRINAYVERYCRIDRGLMFEMINKVRYGTNTLLK